MVIQTPWIERKFEFNYPAGLFPVILERLRGTVPRLESLVKDIPEPKLENRAAGKWSVKELVGHLYDLEELWYGRILDFLEKKQSLRAADMNNAKTNGAGHQAKTIHELIRQFSSAREILVSKAAGFDEATVNITALHPRLQIPMRLADSLFFVAEHDDHHLSQIRFLINQ